MVDDTRVSVSIPSSSPSSIPTPSFSSPPSPPTAPLTKHATSTKRIMKIIVKSILTLVLLGSIIGAIFFLFKDEDKLESLFDNIKALKILGNLIIALAYLPCALPFAVVSYYVPLSLCAGLIYREHILGAFATTMFGSVVGSLFGFWVTRRFCREWVEDKIKASTRISALMKAMESHAFKVTVFSRFLPLPFGLQNGLCAMTQITPEKFVISSMIGLMPENIVLIYIGSSFKDFKEIVNGGHVPIYEKILMGVVLAVTIIVLIVVRKMIDATLAVARAGNKKTEDQGDVELKQHKNGNGGDNAEVGGDNTEEDNFESLDSPLLNKSSSKISQTHKTAID